MKKVCVLTIAAVSCLALAGCSSGAVVWTTILGILGDSGGRLHLFDGKTGQLLHRIQLSGNIEATPVVFNDTLVIGTREKKIYGIHLG